MTVTPTPRTAIVTGASRGIGPYIARALAERGFDLLLVARSAEQLALLAAELRSAGHRAEIAAVDLARPDAAQRIVSAATATLRTVDAVVNNAAVEPQRHFHTLDIDEIDTIVQVNLLTPLTLSRLLLPGMLERGYGRIVNISSLAGHTSFPFTETYAATKDGLTAFSRVLHSDYRARGVTATSLILGPVGGAGIGQRTMDELGVKIGRAQRASMVQPERVARAVLTAIDKQKAELVVMPGPGRLVKALMDLFPGLGPFMNRVSGAERTMSAVADVRERQHAAVQREAGAA